MKTKRPAPAAADEFFDRFDLNLLRVLLADSRKTLQEIGAEVGLSPTSCWSRIKKLESQGVIRRYTIEVDAAKLGYRDSVIVQLGLDDHGEQALAQLGTALAAIPEVQEAFQVAGDYDFHVRVVVRDTRDYERLLREKLYQIPGVKSSRSQFVLRVLKEAEVPIA